MADATLRGVGISGTYVGFCVMYGRAVMIKHVKLCSVFFLQRIKSESCPCLCCEGITGE